ncbi:MAG: nucleotide cyclase [Monoraphidium minutum]|nr:MAG: nucleotide cyclase [Monoraphidium minutum]
MELMQTPARLENIFWNWSSHTAQPTGLDDPGLNMNCPFIQRNPSAPTTDQVLSSANLSGQAWRIDPEYYWFQACSCVQGFQPSFTDDQREIWEVLGDTFNVTGYEPINMQVLTCRPTDGHIPLWQLLLAILFAGLVGAGLVMVAYFFCCRRVSKPVRAFNAIKKRALGMPRRGRMSVVVTDIEGYSDMMSRSPELMFRALTMHNNAIRKAKWANCGYTLEQEGDSYALVFREPRDAVGFCLQAQLMLNEAFWPPGLLEVEGAAHPAHAAPPRAPRRRGLVTGESVPKSMAGLMSSVGEGSWFRRYRSAREGAAAAQWGRVGWPVGDRMGDEHAG